MTSASQETLLRGAQERGGSAWCPGVGGDVNSLLSEPTCAIRTRWTVNAKSYIFDLKDQKTLDL